MDPNAIRDGPQSPPAVSNAIAQGDDGTNWRREWRKYCCRLYYDKNRDAILAKHRDAYQKRREGQPKRPMGRPKLPRDPPCSNKRQRCE